MAQAAGWPVVVYLDLQHDPDGSRVAGVARGTFHTTRGSGLGNGQLDSPSVVTDSSGRLRRGYLSGDVGALGDVSHIVVVSLGGCPGESRGVQACDAPAIGG